MRVRNRKGAGEMLAENAHIVVEIQRTLKDVGQNVLEMIIRFILKWVVEKELSSQEWQLFIQK